MNKRLARQHAALIPAHGVLPANWIICHAAGSNHPMPYPNTSLCSGCCPEDPPAPAVGMHVIEVSSGRAIEGTITVVNITNFFVQERNGGGINTCYAAKSWLVDVVPDFTRWALTTTGSKIVSASASAVAFSGPNEQCCDCGNSNPYPDDNLANCTKGWRCSRCKTIQGMQ